MLVLNVIVKILVAVFSAIVAFCGADAVWGFLMASAAYPCAFGVAVNYLRQRGHGFRIEANEVSLRYAYLVRIIATVLIEAQVGIIVWLVVSVLMKVSEVSIMRFVPVSAIRIGGFLGWLTHFCLALIHEHRMVSFVARFMRIETGESGEDEGRAIFLGPDNTRYWMPLYQCGSAVVRENLKVNQYYIVIGEIGSDWGYWYYNPTA